MAVGQRPGSPSPHGMSPEWAIHQLPRPFRAWPIGGLEPRAALARPRWPWAGLSPHLWCSFRPRWPSFPSFARARAFPRSCASSLLRTSEVKLRQQGIPKWNLGTRLNENLGTRFEPKSGDGTEGIHAKAQRRKVKRLYRQPFIPIPYCDWIIASGARRAKVVWALAHTPIDLGKRGRSVNRAWRGAAETAFGCTGYRNGKCSIWPIQSAGSVALAMSSRSRTYWPMEP